MNVMTTRCDRDRLRRRRTAPVAVTTFALPLILASCSGGEASDTTAATDAQETVTVTATTEPDVQPTQQPTSTPVQAPSTTPTACTPSEVTVATDAARIAQPFPDNAWAVWQTGNLCGTLGYAELVTEGGTGSSPTQLLLYNEGRFLGTGITCNSLGHVTDATDDSVSVEYRWPVGDDSNANMRGRATVTFHWNGSSVDMLGELPQEALVGC